MAIPGFTSPPTSQPAAATKANLPMLYYGLIVVGTAAAVLAIYNFMVIRWCPGRRMDPPASPIPFAGIAAVNRTRTRTSGCERGGGGLAATVVVPASFKYKTKASGDECAVCLSALEEGEDIRKLPRCGHAFHAPCIDMWLYSHPDCPLCRAPLAVVRR